jgi:predicted nuclease of restriction endonuclease-like (RecB) superfamily
MSKKNEIFPSEGTLLTEIKLLINQSRQQVAVVVNSALSLLYWQVGNRIRTEILHSKRAEYGEQIVHLLAKQLTSEYGKGWSEKQLRHCLRFAETFPDSQIVSEVRRQLSWTHIKTIIYLENEVKRQFYVEMCKMEKWSTRTLQERINSMLFERTAISKKPEMTIIKELNSLNSEQLITPDLIFRDPYFLDFLGLKDTYSEKDMESAIVAELERFIIEFGSDFAFMARQKRITIDNEDYYLDLLFYHRRLKCMVAIELKLQKFEASHKGQMELYLRWLEKYESVDGENKPLGLILCADKNEEHIELLRLDESNIKVAEYLTKLPDMKVLKSKLHQAIEQAKNNARLQ